MKENKDKIDLLFERNAAEQLSKVDWDKLNAAILGRLEQARQGKTTVRKYPAIFKIAAAAAVAAVVLIAVMVKTEKQVDLQLEEGKRAVVKFVEKEGSALVEIRRADSKSVVMIDIGGGDRKVAMCNVEIIERNGGRKRQEVRAAWIIIRRSEPVVADNGISKDMMAMICLF